ncbi:MAG TPA: pyridoxamine 5'-phosphate oxidase [Bacteroidetes bacterium]|nr:pyridoxamine 5'-phosphate oxidase [Bacteroidota bacterium]
MASDIDKIRRDYKSRSLDEADLHNDPIQMFLKWFDEAGQSGSLDVNAMTLATVDESGKPSTRIVLLKGVENDSFVFFTNYLSRKGQNLAANPNVSLCFFWPELERQIRIDGTCSKIASVDSEKYFRSRPYESQIGAWASAQSSIISSRTELENNFKSLMQKYPTPESIPFPEFWGGYKVNPTEIEFWQGRSSRLHDRFLYLKQKNSWTLNRMSP